MRYDFDEDGYEFTIVRRQRWHVFNDFNLVWDDVVKYPVDVYWAHVEKKQPPERVDISMVRHLLTPRVMEKMLPPEGMPGANYFDVMRALEGNGARRNTRCVLHGCFCRFNSKRVW